MEDLSLHILDVVENSIEANASKIRIKIIEEKSKDLLAIEIKDNVYRGLWKMENEFMGGPFLMKIYRKEDGIVAISIGIVFAPGEAKKRFMIEMDALL